jgi:hypothetical protein
MKKGQNEAQVASKLAEAQGYRATFREVVERARASGGVDQVFVDRIETQFGVLEEQIQTTTDEEVLQNLCDRAEELERLRAYVLPDHEILLQARTCLTDMRDWGVPRSTLRSIEADLLPAMNKKDDLPTKRAALHKLFDFYDAWEAQVTSYDAWIGVRTRWLSVLLALALPPMLGWGPWAALPARMYSRIGLGIAGTLAGGGLMANGVITIGKDAAEFSEIISTSHQASTSDGLYMVAIGILLGFSERLLSTLAGALVKSPASPAPSKREPVKKEAS